MYAILRGANSRRHEVDFGDDPVVVDVAMSDVTVQITMTASGDPVPTGTLRDRYRSAGELVAAMAEFVNRRLKKGDITGIRVVGEES